MTRYGKGVPALKGIDQLIQFTDLNRNLFIHGFPAKPPFSLRIPVRIPVEIMQRNIERPTVRTADGRHNKDGADGEIERQSPRFPS
jgi:hypothetical protein